MSKKNESFHTYIMGEVFAPFPEITAKKMFGGFGYYKNGIIFGILAEGSLYFKVGETNKPDYEKYESKPFTFLMKNGKRTTISYWELPADILEERESLETWIEKSVAESIKDKSKKKNK